MEIIIKASILGIIQGITEFFPVSSSAHLTVFPWLFNWAEISPSFDLALHLGTILALIVFFFKDGLELVKNGFSLIFAKTKDEEKQKSGKLFWYIVISTIPAGILSLALDWASEKIIGNNVTLHIVLIAVASIIMGLLLYFIDKKSSNDKKFEDLNFMHTFLICVSQAFAAAFPGVSRSGVTITLGRKLGYNRESCARLSFLLSIPMVLAAVIVKVKDFDLSNPIPFLIGIVLSFIVGLIVLKGLFNYLKNKDYKVFAIYRVIFGVLLIIGVLIRMFI